jgi:hypothetical protein
MANYPLNNRPIFKFFLVKIVLRKGPSRFLFACRIQCFEAHLSQELLV